MSSRRERTVTFDVTASGSAAVNSNFRISALYRTGSKTGYTDEVVRIVPPVEGRFERWGKWEAYDNWLTGTAPRALRIGRSAAVQSIGIDETITVPVDVHNRSAVAQSGAVELELPANFTADAASKPYGTLAPGEQATVEFELTNTDATLPANQVATIPIETSCSAPAGAGREDLAISLAPTTTIPEASAAPELDGSEHGGPALDVGRRWEGTNCDPPGVDCGAGTYAKVTRHGDDLYFFVHVRELPELRRQAGGVRRALVRGLGRDHHRPARDRVPDQHGHRLDVQAGRLPVQRRPVELQPATASTARAGLPTWPLGRASDLR